MERAALASAPVRGRVVPGGAAMAVQIGLVGQRADLALEVASLASQSGAVVIALDLDDVSGAATGVLAEVCIDLVLVDVATPSATWGGDGHSRLEVPTRLGVEPDRAAAQSRVEMRADPAAGAHPRVVVVCRAGEGTWARGAALALGCAHVVELPLGAPWLVSQLAAERGSAVLGVLGALGGVGATTVAIACAVGAGADCLLVDADPDSPGLDLPLGIPEGAGVRWPGIPDTSEPLDPASLRSALPWVDRICVVTGSGIDSGAAVGGGGRAGDALGAGQVAGVLGVGRAEFARTVVDSGRGGPPVGLLGPGDAVALVLPATLAGVVAGRRILGQLPALQVVVLLRPTGWLPADEVAEQLGVQVALEVPRLRHAAELADCGDLLSGRTGRALRSLGEQVWGQLG